MTRVVKIRGHLGPMRLEFDAEYEDPPPPEPKPPKRRRWQRAEIAFAWLLLVGSLVGWPLSAVTWAKGEPQVVLGLSWLALTFVALDLLKTSRVHRDQER